MGFLSIATSNVRNLDNKKVNVDADDIFLVGENGQGKTNFLETIYFLCYGSSFRTKKDSVIKKHGCHSLWARGEYSLINGDINTVFVQLNNEKKEIFLNKKKIQDRKDLIKNIPCIIFSHDDIRFIKGSPDKHLWFFHHTTSLIDR